jgi:hypothetical protein
MLEPVQHERWFPGLGDGLRDWRWSEFAKRWRADLHDRWLWKHWAVLVLFPMVLADSILGALKIAKQLTPHTFDIWSEVIFVLCVLSCQQLSGYAARRRKKAAAESNQ